MFVSLGEGGQNQVNILKNTSSIISLFHIFCVFCQARPRRAVLSRLRVPTQKFPTADEFESLLDGENYDEDGAVMF